MNAIGLIWKFPVKIFKQEKNMFDDIFSSQEELEHLILWHQKLYRGSHMASLLISGVVVFFYTHCSVEHCHLWGPRNVFSRIYAVDDLMYGPSGKAASLNGQLLSSFTLHFALSCLFQTYQLSSVKVGFCAVWFHFDLVCACFFSLGYFLC